MSTLEKELGGNQLLQSKAEKDQEKERKREAKKDLNFYDSKAIEYEKINKDLYIESKEISDMTPQ